MQRVRKSVRAQDLPAENMAGRHQKLEANREVSARAGVKARIEREKKSMESVGENIVVGARGSLSGSLAGDSVSLCAGILFASASLSSGDQMGVAPATRAAAALSRPGDQVVMNYDTARGTPGQLVGGTV